MHSFIPHKDNPHRTRRIAASIFIMVISMAIVYFFQLRSEKTQAISLAAKETDAAANEIKAPEDKQKVEEKETVASVEDGLNEEEEKEIEKKNNKEKVLPPPIIRSKNPQTRLEEAKTYAQAQITEGKYIDISLKYQNMVLFENGEVADVYLISSGKKGMDTPKGTFKIENKVPRAWSKTYSLYMPYWMAIVPGGKVGIHELPEWPGGYKEGANHLGIAVSHGCVRLGVGPAKRVYEWADVGTPVVIHN